MSKILIIAEKPSVAKDIAIALGGFSRKNDWLESANMIVGAGRGHLVELYSEQMATGGKTLESLPVIPDKFDIRVIEGQDREGCFETLSYLLNRDDVIEVVNACDAGREGELIFRLIYRLASVTTPVSRLWLRSMTPEAIRSAFSGRRPSAEYDALADAAYCRTEGDYLVGINGSRGITALFERVTARMESRSVGRVQTPTAALVLDRENEIKSFVPKDYWEIHGSFQVSSGTYSGKLVHRMEDPPDELPREAPDHADRFWKKESAEQILNLCTGEPVTSVFEESKPSRRQPPSLFDLTLLQREANRRYGFSAKLTLDLAQSLYEKHKAATYPRTDSTHLPEDYVDTARAVMTMLAQADGYSALAAGVQDSVWGKPSRRVFDSNKVSDHFAIVPTARMPEALSEDESKIYDMIVRRFISAFYPDAVFTATVRVTAVAGHTFKSTGRVLQTLGWLAVEKGAAESDGKEQKLCAYIDGEPTSVKGMELKELKTRAPARYTVDTLLGAMEGAERFVEDDALREALKERGLGTPATRAVIIDGLLSTIDGKKRPKQPYLVLRKDKCFEPTEKLSELVSLLRENGIQLLTSPQMTGEWEHKLRQMERGQYNAAAFRQEIAAETVHLLSVIKSKASSCPQRSLASPCPKCGQELRIVARAVQCAAECGFELKRFVAQRYLSEAELVELLDSGQVLNLDGFVGRTKKQFMASLRLKEDHTLEFFFDPHANTYDKKGQQVICSECANPMRRVKGANGYFWSCTNRDACSCTLDDSRGNPVPKASPEQCPKCPGQLNRIRGKSGYFWACSNRTECGHTVGDNKGKPAPKPTTRDCPTCGKAMFLRERRQDKKQFWGCSGYAKDGSGCNTALPVDAKSKSTAHAEPLMETPVEQKSPPPDYQTFV